MSFDPQQETVTDPTPPVAPATSSRDWRTTELATLRAVYPMGGADGVRAVLPHRTLAAIRAKASAERIRCKRPSTQGLRFPRIYPQRDDIDNAIREGYMHAKAKGDIKALAARIGRPDWWVQKRAAVLGLTRTNRTRLDSWTAAELQILEDWASCTIRLIAQKLRQAGHRRTETAVAVKLKRLKLDRTDPDRWSATALAPMLGVNPVTIADWIERRGLPAERVGDGRGTLMLNRKQLRSWIARNPRYIDLRRVDQPWFMELVFGSAPT